MDPWRLRVKGTAGSGKTQLALSVLQEASTAGKNSIYVCFNRPLADAMKRIVPDPSAVVTFHELARLTSALAGYPLPDFGEKDVFEQLERRFLELAGRLSETFDAVIIDEGQDMHASWASSLIGMAKPNAPLLWLEDTDQSLYDRDAVDLPGWVTISSPVNYRSPKLLVEFINWLGLTDTPIETGGALLGFDPAWYVYADSASAQATTDQAVRSLLSEGFSPENIAVLSFRGIAQSQIAGKSGPDKIAGVAVRRQQGYDDQGSAIWTEGKILVDTVYRFKGQAADAVVITEIDFSDWSDKDRRKLFVALTRARLQAVLVTSERAAHIIQNRLEG
jgi:superfamily I DNA and RNA helicase